VSGVRIGHPARHYKGELYTPLRLATGVEWDRLGNVDPIVRVPGFGPAIWAGDVPPSENRGPVVAYSRLSDDGAFARPVSEWLGTVAIEGREVARYAVVDVAAGLDAVVDLARAEETLTEIGVAAFDGDGELTVAGRIEDLGDLLTAERTGNANTTVMADLLRKQVENLTDTIAAANARLVTACKESAGAQCGFLREIGDVCDACPRHHLITLEAP
jgi:hypothetical protein